MKSRLRPSAVSTILLTVVGLAFAVLWRFDAHAQQDPELLTPKVGHAVSFAVSRPLGDIADTEGSTKFDPDRVTKTSPIPLRRLPVEYDLAATLIDPVIQDSHPGVHLIPEPAVSSDGLSNADNAAAFGFRVSPPDTNGDVGPNHYVQSTNLLVRVFNKSGAPLTPAFKMSSLFASLGGPCAARDDGDPIVLYDPLADRWLLSQFCTAATPNTHQLIAISQSGDPAGAYFLYDFPMPNDKVNDYPKFGVWPDGYYMTDNQFNQAGTLFLGAGVFAFDRAKMLDGDPTASFIYFDLATNKGGMLPADLDGLIPPPVGAPAYFAQFLSLIGGNGIDAMRIFEFHADFVDPASSTFTQRSDVPVAAFDPRNPSGRADIEQPPPALSTHSLDSIQDRLMFRLQYRNFSGRESLVTSHTVNASGVTPSTQATHRAGVRYYELRRSLPGGSFTVPEQATFAPDTDNRWMGSAAMDHQGNLAIGYSVSSLTTFPSLRYAGRLSTDPPNGLPQGETTFVAGTGVQRSTGSRWGDYSALTVDPADDCTFWFTSEYYTAASQASSTVGWLTRIGSFSFPVCTQSPRGTLQGVVTNSSTGLPMPGARVTTSNGFHRTAGVGGSYSMVVSPDTYDMTASFPGFRSANASAVVSDGGTTTVNFVLTPIPIIHAAGSAIVAENFAPATGRIDPGETVSVTLALQNVGSAATSNLVATLLPTGGITLPDGPHEYGMLLPGGPAVSAVFSFTADAAVPCGETITATLQLQDGNIDLGTVTYAFQVGALSVGTTTADYTANNLPVPIPDASMVEIPINVPDMGSINDLNVRVRLDHTFDGDLVISLVHPSGVVVALSSNRGGAGVNFGSGPNDCSGTFTVFDDAAASSISAGVAPFSGLFRPETPLSSLNGKSPTGTWKLRIADTGALDVGTVGCVQLEINRRRILCVPFVGGVPAIHAAPPAVVTAENASPSNGALDPDETVTVNFPLQNVGDGITSNLIATLLPGDGVSAPTGPQNYGALSPVGAPASRAFSFVARGECGGTVTATFHLQDGANYLGLVTFTLPLGALAPPALAENFDGVVAPALPAGWTATLVGTTTPPAWATTTTTGFVMSAPNGAATGSAPAVSESRLTSPPIVVPMSGTAQVTFRNNYSLETGFDGGVLEVSVNGGVFTDIVTAGGNFVAGGYNRTISASASFQSPIAGRMAWSGTGTSGSNGFVTTTINLPSSMLGQTVALRWRAAFDNAVSPTGAGWRIDDVSLSTTARVCSIPPSPTSFSELIGAPAIGLVGDSFTVGTTLTRDAAPAGPVTAAPITFELLASDSTPVMELPAITDSTGFASVSFTLPVRGPYSIVAHYAGSSTLAAATSAPATGTGYQRTLLAVSAASGTAGSPVTLQATLTALPGGTAIGGEQVNFTFTGGSGAPASQSATTDAFGVATVSVSFPTAGSFTTQASFLNAAGYFADHAGAATAETANASVTIALAATTLSDLDAPSIALVGGTLTASTTLTRSAAPVGPVAGAPITFTLSVSGSTPVVLPATTDGAGAASVAFSLPQRGPYTLSAQFAGSSMLAPATSSPATGAVYQRTSLSMPAATGNAGSTLPIRATLTAIPGGTPIAGQIVNFVFTGSGAPGPRSAATDASGVATVLVPFPTAGSFTAQASFINAAQFFAAHAGAYPVVAETASASVNVRPTVQTIIDTINGLHLPRAIELALKVPLTVVERALQRDRRDIAIAGLRGFIVEVQFLRKKGHIPEAGANTLIAQARAMLDGLLGN